ncbi:MAG: hypothetical protein JW751_25590 [Polyangiaceae bacterium]|nr:hypothetical protein [Polyangiaceae bacterium]
MSAGRISGDASEFQGMSHEPNGLSRKAFGYQGFAERCPGSELCSTDLTVRTMALSGVTDLAVAFDGASPNKWHDWVRVGFVQRSSPGGV